MAPDEIRAEVRRQNLFCKLCGLPIVIGTNVLVQVVPGTPQELSQRGFSVPPHVLTPPPDKQN
jgi:hypothetical protein